MSGNSCQVFSSVCVYINDIATQSDSCAAAGPYRADRAERQERKAASDDKETACYEIKVDTVRRRQLH